MGGARAKDGLSLYPLQWMLIESNKVGLIVDFSSRASDIDNPLKLVFPTTFPLGATPAKSKEDVWKIQYQGGFEVEMHCLDATHRQEGYEPRVNYLGTALFRKPRVLFDEDNTRRGWKAEGEVSLFSVTGLLD